MGGRLDPICRTCTRAQDRCLLPSPGLAFHIGRPEGSSSSPQTACIRRGSSAAPLRHGACSYPRRRCTGSSCRERPASNSTVQARGVVLRGGPGGQAPCGALSRTGRPYHPLPFRLRLPGPPARERKRSKRGGVGCLFGHAPASALVVGEVPPAVGLSCQGRLRALRELPVFESSLGAGGRGGGEVPPAIGFV